MALRDTSPQETGGPSTPTGPETADPNGPATPDACGTTGRAAPDASSPAVSGPPETTGRTATETPETNDSPATAAPLDPTDRDRLLSGAHHDPHALLGAHPVPGGIAFRALRPYARAVSVVIDGTRSPLTSDGGGLFSTVLPLDSLPAYTLLVSYAEGDEHEVHDPYRFLPPSANSTCTSSRRGGTRSCGRRSARSR